MLRLGERSDQFLKTTLVSRTFPVTGLVSWSDSQRSIAALKKKSEAKKIGVRRIPTRGRPTKMVNS